MRVNSEMVRRSTDVCFINVGDSSLYSLATLYSTYTDQALLINNVVCLCVLYLHFKDTSPAPSRPSQASLSFVEVEFLITLSEGT